MKYLITGLGNVGDRYHPTRHNIGFRVVDHLAIHYKTAFSSRHLGALATIPYAKDTFYLLKPATYMNLSGQAIAYWLEKLAIKRTHSLVIVDDLHLPFGQLRLLGGGGDGGHNGLKHITTMLGTHQYPRLRFGIGAHFTPGNQGDYVLAPFTTEENDALQTIIPLAGKIVISFCTHGLSVTMNQYNRRSQAAQ